jgi:hypothetical protein
VLESQESVELYPGQTRPVTFRVVNLFSPDVCCANVELFYHWSSEPQTRLSTTFMVSIEHVDQYKPHRITYKHSSGIITYAILRAPSQNASCSQLLLPHSKAIGSAPVLLQLHGAGVDVNDDLIRGSFDKIPDLCAFVISPSGVTTWSGDDWRK